MLKKEDRSGSEFASLTKFPLQNTIELRGVSHVYRDASQPALSNIDLTVRCGESIGIVGPSGAGKTTLVDVFIGLTTPSSGEVLIDGQPVSADELMNRRLVGYVPQEVNLLDDTLRRNIAYSIGTEEIDNRAIGRVIELAGLDGVIRNLPDGLDTPLGERGVRLSGGQRQRIAIARALYRDPEILVLDEATASLDNESEFEIARAITNLTGHKTIITIAHRLSTIRDCGRIVFMRDGCIEDTGTFDALYARSKPFQNLVKFGDLRIDQSEH